VEKLLNAREVAVPRRQIWRMVRRGELPIVRISPRGIRFRPEELSSCRVGLGRAWLGSGVVMSLGPRPRTLTTDVLMLSGSSHSSGCAVRR
jgi:hypothetical protein